MKLSSVKVNPTLALNGVWRPFGEADENGKQARLLIAYSGNENFRAKLAQLTRNAQSQMPGREVPTKTFQKINREALVGTVLLGWEEFEEDDSTPEKPNYIKSQNDDGMLHEENARRLLSTPIIHDFVTLEANKLETFQSEGKAASDAAMKSGAPVEP